MTAIIILNWNGADDTIECVDSLLKVEEDYFCVIADNRSTDDSVERIERHLSLRHTAYRTMNRQSDRPKKIDKREFIILKNGTNMGFAKGNNEAIRFISDLKPDRFLLLNNDTIVTTDFLSQLLAFAHTNPDYKVLTPLIFYCHDKEKIWNAGGRLFYGYRKYYYNGQKATNIVERGHIDSTFVTGCAMLFTPDLLRTDGGIFTEDFFFGEEDFNLCIRMKREKVKMACVLDSIIYHKVNSSTKHVKIGKYYIHYLNRFIDIKKSYGLLFYTLWSMPSTLHAIILLLRHKYNLAQSIKTMTDVNINAWSKDQVSQQDFLQAIQNR